MISFDGKNLIVQPPRNPSKEVKEELGGFWDSTLKAWKLPPTAMNVLTLVDWYGESFLNGAPDSIRDLIEQPWGFRGFSGEELDRASQHPSWAKLYPHQREGVEYLYCNPHGAALCALSWGLGKAATSIVAADLLEAKRVLVLAPLTLAPAWIDEWATWSSKARDVKRSVAGDRSPGPEVTIANHEVIQEVVLRDEHRKMVEGDLEDHHAEQLLIRMEDDDSYKGSRALKMLIKVVEESLSWMEEGSSWTTNPTLVSTWIKLGPTKVDQRGKRVPARERIVRVRRDYLEVDWDLIIVDESVLLKNRKAVKVDVLQELRRKKDPFIFLLSGSPTTKWRDDLWPQMKTLMPRAFKSYWRFAKFFCVVDEGGWGWTIEGDRPIRDPHSYLRDFMWVKSEDEAIPGEIPEYIETHLAVDPTPAQGKAMETMLKDWVVELEDHPEDTVEAKNWLSRNTRLMQITSNLGSLPKPSGNGYYPASSAKEDILAQLLKEDDIKLPLLVWTWFVETTESVIQRIRKERPDLSVERVIGGMSNNLRDPILENFKQGNLDVLVLQMSTGKFGHTFTKTQTVFYHDRSFDSDAYVQSLRRVRRLGLTHQPQLIIPKINGSHDHLVDLNLEGKLESMARMTNADLARLLRSLG